MGAEICGKIAPKNRAEKWGAENYLNRYFYYLKKCRRKKCAEKLRRKMGCGKNAPKNIPVGLPSEIFTRKT